MKSNCYNCSFRRDVPGDAHSRCAHPIVEKAMESQGLAVFQLMILTGVALPLLKGLTIKGNPHGIKNGWFMWPFNFDPTWLEECSGYKPIKKETETK